VAAVKITEGEISVGDSMKFSGHTTDFIDVIESMEVDNKSVQKAVAGDFIGVKVSDRVRPGDEVFKVIPD
jgi:putative protease